MRNKSIYLLVSCVCGTVAAILASQWLKAQATGKTTSSTTEIFVAAVAIDIGEKITPEKIQLEQWPTDKIPQGSSGRLSELEDKYARQRFYVGEAIMPVKLMDENWTTRPKGYKVVAMKASDVGIANLVQPGDRVDVMAYFSKSELIPRSMTRTVLRGVRVYALDGDTQRKVGEDRPKTLRTIQLLIREEDAEAWTYANELGNIQLNLGSEADYGNQDGSNNAGEEFLAWLDEHRKKQEAIVRVEPDPVTPEPEVAAPAAPEPVQGYSMIKMVEGKLYEYWIEPGKLPIPRGEVGVMAVPMDSATGESKSRLPTISQGGQSDNLGYLNQRNGPFFEKSDDPESSDNDR